MGRLRARRPEREAGSPALARLRRLRLSLTALFTVALAVGLAVLAALVLHKDSEARLDSLESTMGRRVTGSSRLIYYSNAGRLRLDGLRSDDLTTGTPEVRVLDGTGPRPRPVFASNGPQLPLAYAQLAAIARRATAREGLVAETVTDGAGDRVRLLAGPFYRDPEGDAAGAVVSAAALGPAESAHDELVMTIVAACAGLLILAAGAGYLLAGRSLWPALRGLAQQEALLADAAHELRTPVASIRATLEAAQLDPSTSATAIEEARSVSAGMSDTLDALLAWARLEAGTEPPRRTELRLDQLVEDVAAEVAPAGQVKVTASPTIVRGDPVLLRIAVRNLLDNAIRHGREPAGPASVEVEVRDAAVTVRDRGPGLPHETLGREGVARFRSQSPDGTGLGISIAARIADLHRGELSAANRQGGGTVVRLDLPQLT
jgi:two-component system, OmpR family, sensor kinase